MEIYLNKEAKDELEKWCWGLACPVDNRIKRSYRNYIASDFEPERSEKLESTIKELFEGKMYKAESNDNNENCIDCIIYLTKHALGGEYRRTKLYKINKFYLGFMVSEHTQNYIKNELLKKLESYNCKGELLETLKSNKLISNFSKNEIKMLLEELKNNEEGEERVTSINDRTEFMKFYLFKLGGKNIMDALIEKYGLKDFACHILETNGLYGNAGYYSGRGVTESDLTGTMLTSIYAQLKSFDEKMATGFIELVKNIQLLTASNFIKAYYSYISSYTGEKLETEIPSKIQYTIGLLTEYKNNMTIDDKQQILSNQIKHSFIKSVGSYNNKDSYIKKYRR